MILEDKLYSDDQAVTADAVSTNVVDGGAVRHGDSQIWVTVLVTEAFATLDSVVADLQSATDAAFSAAIEEMSGEVILTANLLLGNVIFSKPIGPSAKRFTRMNYTTAGAGGTAGKLTAFQSLGPPDRALMDTLQKA